MTCSFQHDTRSLKCDPQHSHSQKQVPMNSFTPLGTRSLRGRLVVNSLASVHGKHFISRLDIRRTRLVGGRGGLVQSPTECDSLASICRPLLPRLKHTSLHVDGTSTLVHLLATLVHV